VRSKAESFRAVALFLVGAFAVHQIRFVLGYGRNASEVRRSMATRSQRFEAAASAPRPLAPPPSRLSEAGRALTELRGPRAAGSFLSKLRRN
jgi:hypothetical protein